MTPKANPLPPATHAFLPADGGDPQADARPLAVLLLREQAARKLFRAEAIARYERAAALAVSMGHPERVCSRPFSIFSAGEIVGMAQSLETGLDRLAARQLAEVSHA
jgi:hypothetical protein